MDEFANISLPEDFDKKLSTMRSRNVFVSIILQNIAQLKALFEKQWESILGNCDELLYLGGNEQGSHKYISDCSARPRLTRTPTEDRPGETAITAPIIRSPGVICHNSW